MGAAKRISASEFQATCLDVLGRVQSGEFSRVEVTERDEVVAVLTRPAEAPARAGSLYGSMRGSVVIPPGVDLTEPTSEGPTDAELGILHR
jgi:antitoxin (DNA-binding transcriptional repressor) of toxin-antitoxin stability system